jgi:hypothetical protein
MKTHVVLALGALLIFGGCGRGSIEQEAEAILSSAKKEAVTKAKEADYNYLKSKLPELKRYEAGANGWVEVNKQYLSSFKLRGTELCYVIYNQNDYGNIKPRFNLLFYDENGVSVASKRVYWLIDSVGPGLKREKNGLTQMRTETVSTGDNISNNIPKYYKLDFKE